MIDRIGKTLGSRNLERKIAKTLHRNGIAPRPQLVKELVKDFEESYELNPDTLEEKAKDTPFEGLFEGDNIKGEQL